MKSLYSGGYKFFGISTQKRLASTLAATSSFQGLTLREEDSRCCEAYRRARYHFDRMIMRHEMIAKNYRKGGNNDQALKSYRTIIDMFNGELVSDLTGSQKEILSRSYLESAEILSVGIFEEKDLALEYTGVW